MDKELVVSKDWMDAALKEGEVDIYSTHRPKDWKKIATSGTRASPR